MSKPIILLLDDEVDLLHVYESAIAMRWGDYDVRAVTTLHDAEAALDAADGDVALAVVDHLLGDQTSTSLVERLRTSSPNVPVILLTGRASPVAEAHARSVGARVLWKPLRLTSFLGEVGEALGAA
jgi:DNA-binding response OmpR family regulator